LYIYCFYINYLVLDFNGTIAKDGKVINDVVPLLNRIAKLIKVYVITADTFGTSEKECQPINCEIKVISGSSVGEQKLAFIKDIGASNTVAVGNGQNDCAMLQEAVLGIAIIGPEGACGKTITSADIVVHNIIDGLNLLLNSKRITATIRP